VYEAGGIAFNSGCQVKLIEGVYGKITAEQVRESVNPDDIHRPPSKLVSLENSTNRGGGNCYTKKELIEIKKVCEEQNMQLHLDGARLFNAMQAMGQSPVDFGLLFDSISICLNKGLGCPMGSILLGNKAFIKKARRIRKLFGGGMRQAGYMAATGLYALEHHVDRLKEDHDHAKLIAAALSKKDWCGTIYPVMTNIVIMETKEGFNAPAIAAKLKEMGILVIAMTGRHLRFVTHLDVTTPMVEKTLECISKSIF
jgi:threonine aldolase